ncbi:MAG TPA: RsmE family RNA methyltransferase [Acidimicrobiales bacterium]|nr:RsmE family RNA methyltransferase [Acidimicrobiales bacterium]
MADLDRPSLSADDRHHLERVLRLAPDEEITVSDGEGGWRPCRFGPELSPVGDVVRDPRPSPPVEVAFALVKGERPEWVVQKLTELGADRIVPFAAARSVVRWDAARAARQVERLGRVAREAAGQCRRTWLPLVEEVATFADVAGRPGAVLAERHGDPPWLPAGPVLVGPEGGWSEEELDGGLPRMALGPHVLRAETAAVAVGALLTALRAGLVAPGR